MIGKMDLPSKKKEYSIRMMIELISEILVGKSACLFSDHCHGGLWESLPKEGSSTLKCVLFHNPNQNHAFEEVRHYIHIPKKRKKNEAAKTHETPQKHHQGPSICSVSMSWWTFWKSASNFTKICSPRSTRAEWCFSKRTWRRCTSTGMFLGKKTTWVSQGNST